MTLLYRLKDDGHDMWLEKASQVKKGQKKKKEEKFRGLISG